MWGAGNRNHPLPPSGQRQQRAPCGNVGATPPMAADTGEDHNFPFPQPEEMEVVRGLGLWSAPEGQRAMGDHNHPLPTASAHSPPLLQMGEKKVVQGLGVWPAPEGHGVMGGHGVTDSPQAGYKGVLHGLGMWPA